MDYFPFSMNDGFIVTAFSFKFPNTTNHLEIFKLYSLTWSL
jgi:hypothetical protein